MTCPQCREPMVYRGPVYFEGLECHAYTCPDHPGAYLDPGPEES